MAVHHITPLEFFAGGQNQQITGHDFLNWLQHRIIEILTSVGQRQAAFSGLLTVKGSTGRF